MRFSNDMDSLEAFVAYLGQMFVVYGFSFTKPSILENMLKKFGKVDYLDDDINILCQ